MGVQSRSVGRGGGVLHRRQGGVGGHEGGDGRAGRQRHALHGAVLGPQHRRRCRWPTPRAVTATISQRQPHLQRQVAAAGGLSSARTASIGLGLAGQPRGRARPPSAKRRSGRLARSFSTMKRRPPAQRGAAVGDGGAGSFWVISSVSTAALSAGEGVIARRSAHRAPRPREKRSLRPSHLPAERLLRAHIARRADHLADLGARPARIQRVGVGLRHAGDAEVEDLHRAAVAFRP